MSTKIEGIITTKQPIVGEITASGASAYDLWLAEGNNGTIQDFLNDLDKHFVFTKINPGTTWTIEHDLNKFPAVTVIDSADTVCYGEIIYINKNKLIINFSAGFSGKAYLN